MSHRVFWGLNMWDLDEVALDASCTFSMYIAQESLLASVDGTVFHSLLLLLLVIPWAG